MVATYSKWKTHATAISVVGLLATIVFAVLLSRSGQERGLDGLVLGLVGVIVAIGALFEVMVSTALVFLVRTRGQVILVHVIAALASIAVIVGMR